jgi:hypothetical protein
VPCYVFTSDIQYTNGLSDAIIQCLRQKQSTTIDAQQLRAPDGRNYRNIKLNTRRSAHNEIAIVYGTPPLLSLKVITDIYKENKVTSRQISTQQNAIMEATHYTHLIWPRELMIFSNRQSD